MKIHFSKYHGSGNDFIMIDERKNVSFQASEKQISRLCDRHFGIGADGLIVIRSSEVADFHMDFYNADGKTGSMCGNGGRCCVAFAFEIGLIERECVFTAPDGLHSGSINGEVVTIDLRDVSSVCAHEDGMFMDTGSPHFIRFVDDVDDVDIAEEGKALRYDARFEGGTNVNFVQIETDYIRVRTYERGVEAETLSCGTGVTASAIAASMRVKSFGELVEVKTKGGDLKVQFTQRSEEEYINLCLTGPAVKVFEGVWS